MSLLARMARDVTERRTAQPAAAYERMLTCTGCGDVVAVFEASTHGPHEHIDPAAYRCYGCLGVPA